jgi:FixJ family two-component response regulator
MGPETAALGDAFLAKPFPLATLREALSAAANSERGRERRRQKSADRRSTTPAPLRAPPVSN